MIAFVYTKHKGFLVRQRPSRLGVVALLLFGSLTAVGRADEAKQTDDVQVLFIGNSFTFFHAMPKMVAELAKAGKQQPLHFMQVTPGGCTLEKHWKDGKALSAIQSRKWDFVVLQEQSMGPIANKESMFEYGKKFDAEIRKQGAKTLLYMTWAYQDKPGDQTALSSAYRELAQEIDAQVAPVGLAWEQAILADGNRPLHEKDKRHPNVTGSYLAACVFYATIYGKSPDGLPGDIGNLTDAKADSLQAIAWKVVNGDDNPAE